MKEDDTNNKSDDTREEPPKKTSSNFRAKVDKQTQDAVFRNLYIPESLKDKIKKPDEGHGR